MFKRFSYPLLALLLSTAILSPQVYAGPSPASDALQASLADAQRPEADRARDSQRKPGELLHFAEVAPGQQIVDLMPGGGYFTRLFSRAVGPTGQVYGLLPSNREKLSERFVQILDQNHAGLEALVKDGYTNLRPHLAPLHAFNLPTAVDLVWTAQNYHDIYGYFGPEASAASNAEIFKALKPGGLYLVIDHVGKPGDALQTARSLHRIDPELVKKQVLAAGFILESESPVLRNPADAHTLSVFAPEIRGNSDQFVLKFRKPRP
ncbi:MAG: class I SAM-dependent methyltransferase [Candidatus Sericytochromatia bacterium]